MTLVDSRELTQRLLRRGGISMLAAFFVFAGCSQSEAIDRETAQQSADLKFSEPWVFSGSTMGTTYRVVVSPSAQASQAVEFEQVDQAIGNALAEVDAKMSTYRADSEISQFNRWLSQEPFDFSAATFTVLQRSQEIARASEGAFDITVAPLIEAWGFGREPEVVDKDRLAELIERVGYDKLLLDPGHSRARKAHPALTVNLSAIAKGYAVDQVYKALLELSFTEVLVEVGGELRASGRPDVQRSWRVAIERPDGSGSAQRIVTLNNRALATSGDYRNFRQVHGQQVAHVFDPRSGKPVAHRGASVSVLADDCMTADAWATALFAIGPQEGAVLATRQGLTALFVEHSRDGYVETTVGSWPQTESTP